jgi:predicted Zn-dependent protease
VLGLPYLSAREAARANSIASADPAAALNDLSTAADLDPLSAYPGRLAGTIALQNGDFATAESRFAQVISREGGGWYGWFGEGLAASALGQRARAHRLLATAARINTRQPIIVRALARVYSPNPVTPREGLAGIQNTK